MIRHHPAPELLAMFAAGGLAPGAALVLACHLERCASCATQVAALESAGGQFLDGLPPTPLAPNALEKALAALDREPSGDVPRTTELPRYLSRYSLPSSVHKAGMGSRRWITPNIWFAPIRIAGSRSLTYLLYGRPDTMLSRHTHRGREFTCVLHGSFHDEVGRFERGDFEDADEMLLHAPTVETGSDCLCIIDAEAPMLLTKRSARVVQTLLGRAY